MGEVIQNQEVSSSDGEIIQPCEYNISTICFFDFVYNTMGAHNFLKQGLLLVGCNVNVLTYTISV